MGRCMLTHDPWPNIQLTQYTSLANSKEPDVIDVPQPDNSATADARETKSQSNLVGFKVLQVALTLHQHLLH